MLFSIVIPAYNYARFLPRAIDSVLAQTGNDCEVVVVDDGSTDDTAAVVQAYLSSSRELRYIHQPNGGVSSARNHGAREAKGDYLLFLDADDEMLPGSLDAFRAVLSRRSPGILTGAYVSAAEGRTARSRANALTGDRTENFRRYLNKGFGMPTGSVLLSKRVLERIRFPENLSNNEDIVLFAQALALFDAEALSHPVLKVHKHVGSARKNIDALLKRPIEAVVDALFDPAVLPPGLMARRGAYASRQCLSRSRACFEAGRYEEGRRYYLSALRIHPPHILQWSYLRKYLRMIASRAS